MSGTWGRNIRLTIFGESHGPAIGGVLDGLPPGVLLDMKEIAREMARRAPAGKKLATPRQEKDGVEVQSGVFEGRTTGTPLCFLIPSKDTRSGDYDQLRHCMRPGHADYAGRVKYGGFQDHRGGGHFSGRLTAPLVFAGAVARQILAEKGIRIGAHIRNIGSAADRSFDPMGESPEILETLGRSHWPVLDPAAGERMRVLVEEVSDAGDSIGGVVECMVTGLPAGLGEPFFDSVESCLAHGLFSIPAVKGVEFGSGFNLAGMRGSDANDPFRFEEGKVRTETNHNGGINGGITNGMPLVFRAAFKATPSISLPQKTVDMDAECDTIIEIKGRHDPCIVPRAVPVVESVAAWCLLDFLQDR